MKKLASLILAIAMILALATTAFASGVTPPNPNNVTNNTVIEDGSITLGGYYEGAVYKIYKMLHLESYNNDGSGAYTYKVETNWTGFFAEDAKGREYVDIDDRGYVSWKTGADPVEFGKDALQYAKDHNITPTRSSADITNFATTKKFTGLTLGYYLVDTSVGVLCGLDTTKRNADISVKNDPPTMDKRVEEDADRGTSTSSFSSTNIADIGETVYFDVTITVGRGAQNYVYHDIMSKGFNFLPETVKVQHHVPGSTHTHELSADEYTFASDIKADGTTEFSITFDNAFLDDEINATDVLYITYQAVLNDVAVIGGEGNPNKAWLTYGDIHSTTHDFTYTYTYGFEIVKTDASGNPLTGAEFQLFDSLTGTTPVQLARNKETGVYRRATELANDKEEWCNNTIVVSNDNGIVRVVGLDSGRYYLAETKAPDGYKKLETRRELVISDKNMYANYDEDGNMTSYGNAVHVENNTGTTLPTTGAMGTAMFITFGMIVVLGAGVLLVTKKRMGMIQE